MQRNLWNDIVSWQTGRLNNSTKKQNLLENCQIHALKLFLNACTWQELDHLTFYVQWASLHDRSRIGPKLVTNAWIDWFHIFIILVNTKQYCFVGNTLKQCRLELFQDWFCRRSWGFKIHFWRNIVRIWKSHVCSISWMSKKQTSESEIISFDAVLRLDGIPALDLFMGSDRRSSSPKHVQSNQERWDPCTNHFDVCAAPHKLQTRKKSHGKNDLNNVDCISSNVNSSSRQEALYVFEDNEAVIKMIINGSQTMRQVSRTNRVALHWLFDRINLDPKIHIKYIDTKNQLADTDQGKFHTWWVESFVELVQY